ncbi:MAG TPA: RHS repeat-associated core domain-containing protein [Candidatus Dormibacteraeota bacterium]|nr:RHS repeat-associated core domain-containing protein [Candidatus Dormibacteraeota bacterium]
MTPCPPLSGQAYQAPGGASLGNLGYTYDAASRQTITSGSLAATTLPTALSSATYDADNRIQSWAGTSYSYDNNGNLLYDGAHSQGWDSRNQLSWTENNDGSYLEYVYNGLGQRTGVWNGTSGTQFLHDGANVVEDWNWTDATAKGAYLNGLATDQTFRRTDASGNSSYFLTDSLGSTLGLTGDAGTSIQTQYTYGPYGGATTTGAANSNTHQFTGLESDGNWLQYSRARYYSPAEGRFISQDPLGQGGGDVNTYNYAANDPVDNTDPSGMFVQFVAACAIGAGLNLLSYGLENYFAGRKGTVGGALTTAAGGCVLGIAFEFVGIGAGLAAGAIVDAIAARAAARLLPEVIDAAEGGGASSLFHYTAADPASIFEDGLLPGRSGNVYLTPEGNLSPLQAHIDLALAPNRGLPGHLFEVDAQGLSAHLGQDLPAATRVTGWPGGGAGGGWEVPINAPIPPWLLRLVR